MSKEKIGLTLFWLGGLYIFLASWLAMWWIAPIWRNTPAVEFEGTAWAFGGPIFMAIAFSVPVGIALCAIGMALHSALGNAGWPTFVLLLAGLLVLGASVMAVPAMPYYPNLFGLVGGGIVLLFLATLWYWARVRIVQGTQSHIADVFQLFSYICFYLTASTSCAMLGNPYGGLFFPETIIQENALPYYYSFGTKIALYLLLGWLCTLVSQYARHRVTFTQRGLTLQSERTPLPGFQTKLWKTDQNRGGSL